MAILIPKGPRISRGFAPATIARAPGESAAPWAWQRHDWFAVVPLFLRRPENLLNKSLSANTSNNIRWGNRPRGWANDTRDEVNSRSITLDRPIWSPVSGVTFVYVMHHRSETGVDDGLLWNAAFWPNFITRVVNPDKIGVGIDSGTPQFTSTTALSDPGLNIVFCTLQDNRLSISINGAYEEDTTQGTWDNYTRTDDGNIHLLEQEGTSFRTTNPMSIYWTGVINGALKQAELAALYAELEIDPFAPFRVRPILIPASGGGATQVGQSVSLPWNLRARAAGTLETRWNVLQTVFDDLGLSWAVREATAASLSAAWNVRARSGAAVNLPWELRETVAGSWSLSWDLLQPVADELGLNWDTLSRTADTLDLSWSSAGRVGAAADLRWQLLERLGLDSSLRWALRARVGEGLDAAWDLRARIGETIDIPWDVLTGGRVGRAVSFSWDLRARVAAALATRWQVLERLGVSESLRWQITEQVSAALQARWALRERAGDSLSLTWDSIAVVARSVQLRWRIGDVDTGEPLLTIVVPDTARCITVPDTPRHIKMH